MSVRVMSWVWDHSPVGGTELFRIEMAEARERDGLADGDLLDVADAAGVTPLPEVDGGQLAADVERWLREQGGQR